MEPSFSRIDKPFTDYEVTPFFKYETVEDVEASRREKRPVMKTIELCELRIAGEKNYRPIVPADSIWQVQSGQPITYAERFGAEYRQFKTGATQSGSGTPLQELTPYGISQSQISLCRALQVYSIEAVHSLEGASLKALGVVGNELKRMAGLWMADQARGGETVSKMDDMARQIVELQAQLAAQTAVTEVVEEVAATESAYAHMSDDELRAYVKEKSGGLLRGNHSRETLLRMAEEA
ncbi:hypothetical protein [Acetobacter orientalis]|uniref:hypothetical protein n=1 Tax=Acetobacter orientalis TaxID=146474 RepID=UPI00241D2536|nr:hypothetical protein [Acetobacter orientalis]